VLDQTYQDFEIIVVDDCSTDNSEVVIKSYKDHRIRFFKNEKNLGMVRNTNKALKLAKGEFVGILHPDDYYAPKMLETALDAFSKNPRVGLVYSSYAVVDEHSKIITRVKLCDCDKIFESKEEFKKLAIRNYFPPSAVLVRKRCYEDVGIFDEEFPYPNDWNMWLRISLKYDSACLSDYLCYYRMHRKSVSTLMYTSFETAMQEYRMLKKFQNKVNPELSLFVEEGARRAAKRALLNSIGGLLTGGRGKALKFFSKALKLEKRNLIWPITPICLFVILSGLNGLRTFVKIYKELPKGLKLLVPFRSPETLFYKYGL
jgi:glycosyltransferase involved in cell wall biosynthesis